MSRLRADETLPAATFATAAPQGAHIVTTNASAFCSLDEAAAKAGYKPFMPQATPGPFKLVDVAVYPHVNGGAEFFGPWFPSVSGQRPTDEVFLRYQLGSMRSPYGRRPWRTPPTGAYSRGRSSD